MKKSIALFCLILLALLAAPTAATTWYLHDGDDINGYTLISGAANTQPGDTIFLYNGTYNDFVVQKPHLSIIGESKDLVTINCRKTNYISLGTGNTYADATGTRIENVSVINSTYGIYISNAPDGVVKDCIIKETGSPLTIPCSNITFENNVIMDNIGTPAAILIVRDSAANCNIINNTFTNATLKYAVIYFYKTTATNNTIAGNTFNDINGNTFYFRDAGDGNQIYLNNNVSGVTLYTGNTPPITYWNSTAPITYTYKDVEHTGYPGNFWSNYTGEDADGDGIIDTPYVLPDGLGTDYEPLAGAWEDGVIEAPVQEHKTWYVDDDGGDGVYTTISEALDAAAEGDTIFVRAGTYPAFYSITVPHLTIKGEGADSVTVDSTGNSINIGEQGTGTTFEELKILKANQVAIYGSDCIIKDCIFDGPIGSPAILINAPNCTFANNSVQNLFSSTTNTGVDVYSASAKIVNNTFVNIPVTTSALYIRKESTNATVENNLFENCTVCRPLTLREVTGCIVANNTFKDSNSEAIRIWKTTATNNVITGNSFGGAAICFRDTGDGNRIYLNNNISGAILYTGSIAPTTTYWNSTAPITYTYKGVEHTGYPGNFWSNYSGEDADGDGIIDTPYVLPDGFGTDYAPLTGAWEDGVIEAPEPKTWYVDADGSADFTTIQEAVDAASSGETIVVRDGAYTENVLVDKPLVIRTENGPDNVTVTAEAPEKPVFDVDADGATIEGFAVRGPTNEHVAGIEIVGFDNCVVRKNDCAGCYNGVHLGGNATGNTVEENSCHDNTKRGISLRDTIHDNLVCNNTCENNADDEICVKDQPANNTIWANTFNGTVELLTANTYHSPGEVTYTYGGAEYTGYVGNRYSLYTGADANGDGIGDTPMSFGTYADDYPMMGAWQNGVIAGSPSSSSPIARIALSPDTAALAIGETQQFTATAYDATDAPLNGTAFVWASSNTLVGTVNATGYFEALAAGTTNVTATADDVTGTATVTVAATPAIEWAPYVTGTTTTTAVIHWRTDLPSNGTLEYADDTYYAAHGGYENTIEDNAATELHHVDLDGLAPDTRYHYRVVAEGTATDDRTFRTFPESGGFTFIIYGDTQESQNFTQLERHSLVAERVAAEDPLFVLHLGDTVNMVNDQAEWDDFFEAGDPVFANTSIYTTLGDHEDNSSTYYDVFRLPEWYSFDCAGAHFAVLDSNDWTGGRMDNETTWLDTDLAGDAEWKFVAFHHPPYSADERNPGGNTYLREEWGPVIAEEKVSVVFSGHVHAYERYLEDSVQYVVTGTGGGPLYPLSTDRPDGYQNSLQHTLGYTKVTVHENGTATMEFIEVAQVSDDNTEVLSVHPTGTVFDPVTLTAPVDLPDLTVTAFQAPADPTVGENCTVLATIENIGDAASPAATAVFSVGGVEIERPAIAALATGSTTVLAVSWTPDTAGTAILTLTIDPDTLIEETDRTNNARTISVTVQDNTGPVTPAENGTLTLNPGWNFISTPKRLSAGNDTAAIFLDVDMAGRPLYAYDAATGEWLQANQSTSISPLYGYWLYSNITTGISFNYDENPLNAPPVIDLVPGWNAIGFSDTEPIPAKYTLSSLGDAWTTLIGYDSSNEKYEVSIINGAEDAHTDLREMQPMQGYWIFLTEEAPLCAISA